MMLGSCSTSWHVRFDALRADGTLLTLLRALSTTGCAGSGGLLTFHDATEALQDTMPIVSILRGQG